MAAATLAFGGFVFNLIHLVLIPLLSYISLKMHVIYMRISKTVLNTVPDTLLTPMEQTILKEVSVPLGM